MKKILLAAGKSLVISTDSGSLIVLLTMFITLATGILPYYYHEYDPLVLTLLSFAIILSHLIALTFHEVSHLVVASYFKLHLNRIKMTIFGGIPEGLYTDSPRTLPIIATSLAGPLINVLLGVFTGILLLMNGTIFHFEIGTVIILRFFQGLNFLIALCNLLPVIPLDTGLIITNLLWVIVDNKEKACKHVKNVGTIVSLLLLFVGMVLFFRGILWGGIWWTIAGLSGISISTFSYERFTLRKLLEGNTVSEYKNGFCIQVTENTDLTSFLDIIASNNTQKIYPVVDNDGKFKGSIHVKDAQSVDPSLRSGMYVSSITRTQMSMHSDCDMIEVLEQMKEIGQSRFFVTEGQKLTGSITLKEYFRYLIEKIDYKQPSLIFSEESA